LCVLSIALYSFFYERSSLLWLILVAIVSTTVLILDSYPWLLFITLLLIPLLFKKISYTQLIITLLFSTILLVFSSMSIFSEYIKVYSPWTLTLFLIPLCILAINGIFQNNLKRYLVYSNTIQTALILVDLFAAKMAGKTSILWAIQTLNYIIAGLLFFLTLGILSKNYKRKKISNLRGSYMRNRIITICMVLAALSLAGIPGLNLFVTEWFLFTLTYTIDPAITILTIFLSLLLFLMYSKVIYTAVIGESRVKEYVPMVLTLLNVGLVVACIIFGLVPHTQFFILRGLTR